MVSFQDQRRFQRLGNHQRVLARGPRRQQAPWKGYGIPIREEITMKSPTKTNPSGVVSQYTSCICISLVTGGMSMEMHSCSTLTVRIRLLVCPFRTNQSYNLAMIMFDHQCSIKGRTTEWSLGVDKICRCLWFFI